jgi:hypothetical protein
MTAAKSNDRLHMLQVHHVVITLPRTECDRDTTVVVVIYGVLKHGRYLNSLQDIWY